MVAGDNGSSSILAVVAVAAAAVVVAAAAAAAATTLDILAEVVAILVCRTCTFLQSSPKQVSYCNPFNSEVPSHC